jgi:hypothetical protein
MDMSRIAKCSVEQCSYNKGQQCHALAITVGDSDDPKCDTFLPSGSKGGDMAATGKVGACKVSVCRFNESLECSAGQIEVGTKQSMAYCLTFEL